MTTLLAHVAGRPAPFWGLGVGELLIAIIVVAACVAIAVVALRYFELTPPPWVIHIIGIIIVCFVAIIAIRLVLSF